MTYDNPSQTKNLSNLLKNKVAFVTGAGSGIGRAGAMAMASQGAHVVVTDLLADKAMK
jgi:NAD(P)-dependent dehydrogenase (short-subunit alcohol dehydrogenase family)